MLAPLASHVIENWSTFMYHYALGLTPESPYRFRNGARLRIGRGTDHVPIIEIFIRKEYGEVPADAVIVDLGASIGAFAIYAATSARNVRVYAYEPLPDFFQLMHTNVRLNALEESVKCFNLAVAADASDRELFVSGPGLHFPTLVPRAQAVPAASTAVRCTDLTAILDTNGLSRVDLLKIDIEGSEYDILYSTPPASFAPIREIRMEYHNLDEESRNVERLKGFLASQRYVITREQANTRTTGILWVTQHD